MTILKQTRKFELDGKGLITLSPSDYVTTGGEGSVYRKNQWIVKLYTDAQKMTRDHMGEKIRLLSALAHDSIVAPIGMVRTAAGDPVGFFMPYVHGDPLVQFFTNDFRARTSVNDKMAAALCARMRETVEYAHGANALMIDANEFNWLAFRKESELYPRVIDVDSWAVGPFKGSVIMPSIRDWHAKEFSAASDWFAWGVVTFQVMTGIHPYKGTLDGFARGDLEGRMKANKSVFTKGVRLNRAVRDFALIAPPLRSWYEAAFEKGERSKPPSPLDRTHVAPQAIVRRVIVSAGGTLVFDKLYDRERVTRVFPCGVFQLEDGSLLEGATKRRIGMLSLSGEVVRVEGGWLLGDLSDHALAFTYVAEATLAASALTIPLASEKLFRSGSRLFAVTERGISEIALSMFGKPILSLGKTWGALPHATQFFDGVGVEDALGAKYLVLPFGDAACAEVRVPELDGALVLNAKAGVRVVSAAIVGKNGTYERYDFVFDRDYRSYALSKTAIDTPELNLVHLPKGVAVSIENDGELTIAVPKTGVVSKIADRHVASDMLLAHWDDRVLYLDDGVLWSVRMK